MAGLDNTLAAFPGGSTKRVYGTAFWDGEEWLVDLGGSRPIPARWSNQIQPLQGMPLAVDLAKDRFGQASALVICAYTDQPRPSTGTVLTIGVSEIVFTGEDSTTYTTDRYIGTYAVGDPVLLDWSAGKPTILGKIPGVVSTALQSAPEAPPAAPSTGTTTLIATKSNTWGVGGWGRWATSNNGGEDVYSGTWGGQTVTGAWFYGAKKPALQGKTITRARIRLPQRLNVGASGAATVHLYAHTSSNQPGGDVARTQGPFNVTLNQGHPPNWATLPSSFHSVLVNGGGISIAGEPYMGFIGRLGDPQSGKIIIDWSS